jgi:hypothetical protein
MSKLPNGHIVSSYFDIGSNPTGQDMEDKGRVILEGQVIKTHFVDDPTNRSKRFVEYDVLAGEPSRRSTFYNLYSIADISGGNNHTETVLEENSYAYSGKLDQSNFPKNMNGTLVYIAFLDGDLNKPFILGGIKHFKKSGATRAEGVRKQGEFNGIFWEINKDGEFTFKYQSNRLPDGKLSREATGPTQVKIDKKGDFELKQTLNSELINLQKFERDSKKITRQAGNDTVVETFDGTNEKVTLQFKSGLIITCDGAGDKVEITTTGGAFAKIDGNSGTIELKDNGTGKLKINGDKVAIGASSAELLQQISDSLQKLITWANSVGAIHTHIGNLGYPTAPPDQASGYSQLGSDLSTIKGKVDGIKGSL